MFRSIWSFLFFICVLFVATVNVQAKTDPLAALFDQQPQFLPVDDAFIFEGKQDGDKVHLNWTIADEYYLYANKFQFVTNQADIVEIKQGEATQIEDEFFGIVDVYFFESDITVTLSNIGDNDELKVRYQGCANAGLCYQPVTKVVSLSAELVSGGSTPSPAEDTFALLTETSSTEQTDQGSAKQEITETSSTQQGQSLQYELLDSLQNQSLLGVLALFFVLGVGLAFTPCVFPMFPILSGIIAGQKNLTFRKGLYLSFVYVQGMALTYSLLGLVVASLGAQFQAMLQHPSILVVVSIIFVLLAGAMFGWYTLQLPASWTGRLTEVSNRQRSGNVVGVFVMGLLSGLIASPCTTAPLTGALLYVAQTGDLFIGFITLYVLSLGMGLPLLLIGASGGKLLPKAGNWMNVVKNVFGFILLTIPLILLERLIDIQWVLMIGGVLLLAFAAYMHSQYLQTVSSNAKGGFWVVSWTSLVLGLLLSLSPLKFQLFGSNFATSEAAVVVSDGESSQSNSEHSGKNSTVSHGGIDFIKVVTVDDIYAQVANAHAQGKVVMLDLYADWCVACKEFEAYTFSDAKVKQLMSKMVLLQVDMTDNTEEDDRIYQEFQVFGLPTIMFFNTQGEELMTQRVTGFLGANEFSAHLAEIL